MKKRNRTGSSANKISNKHSLNKSDFDKFFDSLISTASVTKACFLSGVSKTTIYTRIKNDEEFRKHFDEVRNFAICLVEDEAMRRAVDGIDKEVFFRGEYVGTTKSYSDKLLIQLMKLRIPDINLRKNGSEDYDALSELDKEKNNIINKLEIK